MKDFHISKCFGTYFNTHTIGFLQPKWTGSVQNTYMHAGLYIYTDTTWLGHQACPCNRNTNVYV